MSWSLSCVSSWPFAFLFYFSGIQHVRQINLIDGNYVASSTCPANCFGSYGRRISSCHVSNMCDTYAFDGKHVVADTRNVSSQSFWVVCPVNFLVPCVQHVRHIEAPWQVCRKGRRGHSQHFPPIVLGRMLGEFPCAMYSAYPRLSQQVS